MILLYFSAPAAETQQILIIQSSLLKLGFPRPEWPEEMVPALSSCEGASTSSPKGWKTVDIKSYLCAGFHTKQMYTPLHCIAPKSCSDTSRGPSKEETQEENVTLNLSLNRAPGVHLTRVSAGLVHFACPDLLHLSCLHWWWLPSPCISPSKGPEATLCARTDGICREQLS